MVIRAQWNGLAFKDVSVEMRVNNIITRRTCQEWKEIDSFESGKRISAPH